MAEKFTMLAAPMKPVEPRKSRFTLLRQPVPTPLSDVGQKGFTTLIAGGVVDSLGPALSVITVDGHFPNAVDRLRVLLITLDPFCQSCHTIGYVDVGDMWSPVEDLEPRPVGRGTVQLGRPAPRHRGAVPLRHLGERSQQPALADAGFPADQHRPPAAGAGVLEPAHQRGQFGVTAHERHIHGARR